MTELLELVSSALASRYRVSHTVGSGGMAVVFHAVELKHERPVAIKVLKPELAHAYWSGRFLREIQIASKLQHPNILPLYDSGQTGTFLYYVMPFIAGESLRARLQREGRLPVAEAVRLVHEIGEGLGYAHERGVVHRDIKPENILLSSGHALICDFGIARALTLATEGLTTSDPGLVIGTPDYMSPEQFAGATELDARSDIYSLGCVLFEMLAGAPPFSGPNPVSLLAQHVADPPPPLRRVRSDVPAAVEAALAGALAKTPEQRFGTAAAFTAALALASDGPGRGPGHLHGLAVAVLPFANLSGDSGTEYLSDGISEELIQALSRVEGLRVVGRTSTFAFKGKRETVRDIGERLRADLIVDGSVRVAGDQIRIAVHLVDAAEGYQLWSGRYQRPAGDMFAIQDEVAGTIAAVLQQRLSGKAGALAAATPGPTPAARRDAAAHEAYLRGRYHWNKRTDEEIARAIACFERAIDRAPDDAASHAALADAHLTLAIYGAAAPEAGMAQARASAERALALDPRSAEAHAALGSVSALYEWARQRAGEHFRLAVQLKPSYATAHQWQAMHLLAPLGRFPEARRGIELARGLDPLSPAILASAAVVSLLERDWDRALLELLEVIDLEPGFAAAHYFLGQVHLGRGENGRALEAFTRAVSLARRSTETLAGLAYAQAVSGQGPQALAVLDELLGRAEQTYVSPVRIAQIHLGLDHRAEALAWLEHGVGRRAIEVAWLGVHPIFDQLRREPAFLVLLDRAGLAARPPNEATAEHARGARAAGTGPGLGELSPGGWRA